MAHDARTQTCFNRIEHDANIYLEARHAIRRVSPLDLEEFAAGKPRGRLNDRAYQAIESLLNPFVATVNPKDPLRHFTEQRNAVEKKVKDMVQEAIDTGGSPNRLSDDFLIEVLTEYLACACDSA